MLANIYLFILAVRKSMLFSSQQVQWRGTWFTQVILKHYCLTSKADRFILYASNKQRPRYKIPWYHLGNNQIWQRLTNIFLIKSHVDLLYTKPRSAYLWQNQAWLKDEVIHNCQGILIIWFSRVEVLLSLCPPARSLSERIQETRNSATVPIWWLQMI